MTTQQRDAIVLFVLAALVRLAFHNLTGFVADDAFITFRYAQNLAAVLGTTTPLLTFILAVGGTIGLGIPKFALAISLVASGVTAVVIYRLALLLRLTHWSVLPAILYIFWPRSIVADSCGMESALFSLLVTAAVYLQTRQQFVNALASATLATLTRPEGVLLVGLLIAHQVVSRREQFARALMIPLFLLGPWLLFATFYFDSPTPQSVTGKQALYSLFGTSSRWDTLVYLMAWHNPFGWLVTIAAIAGLWWLAKKQNWGGLAGLWIICLVGLYVLSGAKMFFWYPAPIYPLLFILAAGTIPIVFDRWSHLEQVARKFRWWAFGVVAVILVAGNYSSLRYFREYQQDLDRCHRAIGVYLHAQVQNGERVAAEDIGYMGYVSGCRILDRDGLISPEAAAYNRAGNYFGLINDFKPEWVVASLNSPISTFLHDSAFIERYNMEQSFVGQSSQYAVYRRRDMVREDM
jgi:hypothetical protein